MNPVSPTVASTEEIDPEVRAPMMVPLPGLPARVTIWEVGARDGLQN
jgi:hypothetical protein